MIVRFGVLVLAAMSLAFGLDPTRTLTQYAHRVWQAQQGLPQGTVYSILQTHDGYLWLGSQTGLIRFDPWISYVLLIGLAVLALHLVEKPAQRLLRKWMGVHTVVKERRVAMVSAVRCASFG